GDPIEVEKKHKQPFTARPTARLIVSSNNAPQFSDKSDGLWRRGLLLPFDVQIPENEQVAQMDKPAGWVAAGEPAGILSWALAGLHDLRREGRFTVPDSCRTAAEKLRVDNNPARRFLKENYREVAEGKESVIATAVLYETYGRWCRENGHHPLTEVG